jgi:16S rRNA processing protein RimM
VSGADRDDPSGPIGLRVGTVARAHGLDGSFHLGAVVESVLALLQVGSEVQVAGHIRRLVRLAGHGGRPIFRLEGCDSRDAAEALRGEDVYVPRAAAPELGEDEWWAEDLEGCAVRDGERRVGTVTALLELPSCEVLEVRREAEGAVQRPALLVPLIRDAVRDVDIEAGVIDVDLAFLGES